MNTTDNMAWFPFGKPPLQHMVDVLTNDMAEDAKGDFLREILTVFAEHQDAHQ